MSTANSPYVKRDLAHVWHPCTQMKDHEQVPLIPIRSGKGVWLEDFDGRQYMDCVSSWWVNLFGHSNPRINAAVRNQLEKLEHVILAGFTHEPVIELSEALVKVLPAGLTRCFYADNGSSAVEVAVKMSFHYWRNVGQTEEAKVYHSVQQLPRRDARCARGWQCAVVQGNLSTAVDGRDHRALTRLLSNASRGKAGRITLGGCLSTWRRRWRDMPMKRQQ